MRSDTHTDPEIFRCQKCGSCCRGYGGTFLTSMDVKTIAEYIEKDPRTFVSRYGQLSGDKPILAQGPDGYCIFWDKLCTIHPVKPRMCSEWPYIKSVLVDVKNWHIMARSCPGMRTDVNDEEIKARVREERKKG